MIPSAFSDVRSMAGLAPSLTSPNERLTSLTDHFLYANVYLVFGEGFLTLGAPIDLLFDFIMHWVIGEIHHSKAHGKIIQSDKILALTFITQKVILNAIHE
jgi:hypothetical protein